MTNIPRKALYYAHPDADPHFLNLRKKLGLHILNSNGLYGHDLSLKFLNSTCTFLTLTLFPYAVTNIIRDVYIISIIIHVRP